MIITKIVVLKKRYVTNKNTDVKDLARGDGGWNGSVSIVTNIINARNLADRMEGVLMDAGTMNNVEGVGKHMNVTIGGAAGEIIENRVVVLP